MDLSEIFEQERAGPYTAQVSTLENTVMPRQGSFGLAKKADFATGTKH